MNNSEDEIHSLMWLVKEIQSLSCSAPDLEELLRRKDEDKQHWD